MCYIGRPGHVHDACVFANSPIFTKGIKIFPNNMAHTSNGDNKIYIFLISNAAYPLIDWLMKPSPWNVLSDHSTFNYHLSSARMSVERAFSILKGMWRIVC